MKATLFVTLDCNFACDYCYITKRVARMSPSIARRALDFLAERILPGEDLDIGFFGGEPLLEFPLVLELAELIKSHGISRGRKLELQLVSNGSLLDEARLESIASAGINLGISCDGIPSVQDAHRRFKDGRPSSPVLGRNLAMAARALPSLMVNAVYRPDSIGDLAAGVEYFYGLGLRDIFLNPDFSAPWRQGDLPAMKSAYAEVAGLYQSYQLAGDAAHISLIDSKIAVLLNGGYAPEERCSMGRREFAFGPEGAIYPCERLAGDCLGSEHRIGHVDLGLFPAAACPGARGHGAGSAEPGPSPCEDCSLRDYCMNWCGCSNFFASGDYALPGPFLCASEKASLEAALETLGKLSEALGPDFLHRGRRSGGSARAGRGR